MIYPICLNTLPKSGSMYLLRTLEKTLETEYMNVSPGYFPLDLLDVGKFYNFSVSEQITQTHIPAHPINLNIINGCLDKFWLHLRDPRSAALSWVYEIAKHENNPKHRGNYVGLLAENPALPPKYFSWSLEDRISWIVKNYMPGQIQWIIDWIEAIEGNKLNCKVLVTEYQEFLADEEAFLKKILTFHGYKPRQYKILGAERNSATNFRSGKRDEWKNWRAEDIEYATSLIPDWLATKFSWEKQPELQVSA